MCGSIPPHPHMYPLLFPSRTHKIYFVIACISRVTDLLLQFCRVLMGLVHHSALKMTLCVSTTGSVSNPEVTTLIICYDGVHLAIYNKHIVNQRQFEFTVKTVYCIQQCSTMLQVPVYKIIFRHKCTRLKKASEVH